MDAEERFAALVGAFADRPGVTVPTGTGRGAFGSTALKVNGSIFAMLVGGQLVVKLPRDRVAALVADGIGRPFDAGKGTPMKEWVSVASGSHRTWLALSDEALDFVGSRQRHQ